MDNSLLASLLGTPQQQPLGGVDPNLAFRQQMIASELASGSDTSPISSPWQGAARMANALAGRLNSYRVQRAQNEAAQGLVKLLTGGGDALQPSSQTGGALGQFLTGQNSPVPAPGAVQNGGNLALVQGSGDPQNALDAIMRFESAGKNVHQNIVPPGGGYNPSTGTVTGPSSASGYFQMIDPTWKRAASMAGIDTSQYPTAMSAPYEVQRKAANALYASDGFEPWAPYNAALRGYIAKNGGASAFTGDAANASPAVAAINSQMAAPQSHDPVVSAPNYNPSAPNPLAYTGPNAASAPAADAIASQAAPPPVQVAQNGQMDANYFPPAPAAPPQSPTLGGQLAAYGGGGMQSGMNPKLLAALLNPALPDSARQLGMGMLQMQMQPKNDFLTRPDGSVVMVNKLTGQAQVVQPAQRNPVFQQVDDPVTGLKRTIAVDPITARPLGELTPNGMVQPGQQQTQAAPGGNGIDIFTGKPNPPAGQVPLAGAPLTNDVKDYRAYAMDQQQRGEPVKSFNEWSMDQKKAGAQSVTIAGETEESKALGAARAKNIVDYMDGGKSAREKLQALQIMESALAAPGGTDFTTGPGAELALKAKQALSSLTGQQLDGVTNAEIIKKTGAYLASAAAKDLANRPTQFDFKTFLENNPGLDISMQGNRLLINIMKQQAQHQMDLARMAQSYKGNSADWNDVVAEYDKSHPILNPMTGKPLAPNENLGFPEGDKGPKAGDVEGGYRFKGGSPGDPSNWEKVQ